VQDAARAARNALKQQDYNKALPLVRMLAAKSSPEFEYDYGRLLLRGWGVKCDTKQAFALISKSAAGSYAPAQSLLGDMYEAGEGTETSEKKALELWQCAAAHGNASAEHRLGGYYIGLGKNENFAHGLELLKSAAKHGDGEACTELAYIYYEGKPPYLNKDPKAAVPWCELGIKNRSGESALLLARMYDHGEGGLPSNRAQAFLAATTFDRSPEAQAWKVRLQKKVPSKSDVDAAMNWYLAKRSTNTREQTAEDTDMWDILNRK